MPATEKVLSHLRRRCGREISSLSTSHSSAVAPPISHGSLTNPNSHPQLYHHYLLKSKPNLCFGSNVISIAPFSFSNSRSFSSSVSDYVGPGVAVESAVESILPVRFLVSLLDGYHDATGWPWWIIIASSTLALRVALFPIVVLQLQKMKRIAELFPKLPPPLPPPFSGRSWIDQLSLFRKEKRAIGCPSYLWFVATLSTQVPCFILWMTSIRRMSLDHHLGFDSASYEQGGALWFANLTEFPNGSLGPIFPILISSLHFINVRISFSTSSVGKVPGLLGLLAKYYKFYLEILTVPIFFIGFCIPQGSLVYWVTNSSLSAIQQLTIRHPTVRAKLGLPDKQAPNADAEQGSLGPPTKQQHNFPESISPQELPGIESMDPQRKQHKISIESLSPPELIALSVKILSKGDKDRAIPFIRMALDKDPNYVRALVIMGQTLLQKEQLVEATDYFERAITKLFLIGHPTKVEELDLLISASQWAGAAYVRQGKIAEGLVHLERIANLKEPDEPRSKAHYFDGLLLLASTLHCEGRNAEAAKHLRRAAAYNPAYKEYLEECEREDGFVNDLESSRRRDY